MGSDVTDLQGLLKFLDAMITAPKSILFDAWFNDVRCRA